MFATIMYSLSFLGWVSIPVTVFLNDHFNLLGLVQAVSGSTPYRSPSLIEYERYKNQRSRNRIMLGLMIGIWSTPYMTFGHFLFATTLTSLIISEMYYYSEAIKWEELNFMKRNFGIFNDPFYSVTTITDYYSYFNKTNSIRQKHPYRYHEWSRRFECPDGMTLMNFDYNRFNYSNNYETAGTTLSKSPILESVDPSQGNDVSSTGRIITLKKQDEETKNEVENDDLLQGFFEVTQVKPKID
jgi:hypothetical protein